MASKKPKKVSSNSIKQPRAKTFADTVYNARKRAKRAVARLEKNLIEGKIAEKDIGTTKNFIESLKKGIKDSYAKRTKQGLKYGENIESLKEVLTEASQLTKQPISSYERREGLYQEVISPAEKKRIDAIWKRNINQATMKNGVSPLNEEEVRMFFRVTQRFWNVKGVSKNNRLEAIVEGLGVRTIQEAYEIVVGNKDVQDALRKIKSLDDGSLDELDDKYKYVERLINKIDTLFSMFGNPFTYENLATV